MRKLEFSITGLTDEDTREQRSRDRGRAAVAIAVLASLIILSMREGGEPAKPPDQTAAQPDDAAQPDHTAAQPDHNAAQVDEAARPDQTAAQVDEAAQPEEEQPQPPPPKGRITVSPEALAFSGSQIGTDSAASFELKNVGNADITIHYRALQVDGEGQFAVANDCNNYYFRPQSACTGQVHFKPLTDGLHRAVLTIVDGDDRVLATLPIEGHAISAAAEITPEQLDFTPPNPAEQRVRVRNVGAAPLLIRDVRVQGESFVRLAGDCVYHPLAPDAECSITVSRVGSVTEPGVTDELHVEHNGRNSPGVVSLRRDQLLLPALSVEPTSVDFGSVNLGSSGTVTLTVTNSGKAPAAPINVGFRKDDGPFVITQNDCTNTLQPLASCTLNIRFQPLGVGGFTNTLIGAGPALQSLLIVQLRGTGVRAPEEPVVQ